MNVGPGTLAGETPDIGRDRVLSLLLVGAGALAAVAFVWIMLTGSYNQFAGLLIAGVLIVLTVPVARHAARIEAWPALTWLVMAAMVLRILGSVARYEVAYGVYGGVADASTYTGVAAAHYRAFRHLHFFVPTTGVFHGLIPWLDTALYAVAGPTELGAFFFFSWISFIGIYLFYRAFRIAYPGGDRRRYALLVFFLPSLLYWPSSLGKEAWMVFAIGLASYGLARALAGRPGGYLGLMAGIGAMLLIRPHLALIFLPAAAVSFLLRRSTGGRRRPLGRLLGIAVLVVSSLVVVAKAQSYFGITNLDVQTVTKELNTTRQQTDLGNSAFNPPNARSPLGYAEAVVTVLYRPFPFEAHSLTVLVASFEGLLMLVISLGSWRRLRGLPRALWSNPYMVFAVLYTALFILAFSNFANFGILARERVQMLPLFLMLLAIPAAPRSPRRQVVLVGASGGSATVSDDATGPEVSPPGRPGPTTLRPYRPRRHRALASSDRLRGPESFRAQAGTFRALDYRFSVEVSGGPEKRQVRDHFAWALGDLGSRRSSDHRYLLVPATGGTAEPVFGLYRDGEPMGEPATASNALVRLVTDVNLHAIQSRPDRLVLHAAALSVGGRGLLLPGPSGSGKTMLAAALATAGCGYLTDEAASIDPGTLEIDAYAKPLSLRSGSLAVLGRRGPGAGTSHEMIPVSALRAGSVGRPVPAWALVLPRYEPGATTVLRPISRAEALVEVANNSFNFVDHGGEWMHLLRRLVLACWCGRLTMGDLDTARDLLLRQTLFAGGSGEHP